MRLVVLQSNYIPWKGYFDLMQASDLFIVYDSVQYTKNDWRNRNRIATRQGPTWLTIPVATAGKSDQAIRDASVSDHRWAKKHWRSVEQALGKRPFFDEFRSEWSDWYEQAASLDRLHRINLLFLHGLAAQLAIDTSIEVDDAYLPLDGSPSERLVMLCQRAGATHYLTGPAGLDYLDKRCFEEADIALEVIDYEGYPVYDQAGPEFTHGVSVLDLLANTGAEAGRHLLGSIRLLSDQDSGPGPAVAGHGKPEQHG